MKKRLIIKDKNFRILMKKGGRVGAKQDYYELLKRAVKPLRKIH
jgi:hypothetical protein